MVADYSEVDNSREAFSSPELGHLPQAEDIRADIEDIFLTVDRFKPSLGADAAFLKAWDTYVDDEENPYLQQVAGVVINAHFQAQHFKHLQALQAQSSPELPSSRLNDARHEMREIKYGLCEFNHQLRDLIMCQGAQLTREELRDWLWKASGNAQWAGATVAGVVSELAIYDALQDSPALKSLRFGSVEEDLKAGDIIGELHSGRKVIFDVKSGQHFPKVSDEASGLKLTVGVEMAQINNFSISQSAREGVNKLAEMAIHQSEALRKAS